MLGHSLLEQEVLVRGPKTRLVEGGRDNIIKMSNSVLVEF